MRHLTLFRLHNGQRNRYCRLTRIYDGYAEDSFEFRSYVRQAGASKYDNVGSVVDDSACGSKRVGECLGALEVEDSPTYGDVRDDAI